MATPTPWQLTQPKKLIVHKKDVYARDLYNFSYTSVSQGTNNPKVPIPSMGPHAAGAIPPSKFPELIAVEVTVVGTLGSDYGANSR